MLWDHACCEWLHLGKTIGCQVALACTFRNVFTGSLHGMSCTYTRFIPNQCDIIAQFKKAVVLETCTDTVGTLSGIIPGQELCIILQGSMHGYYFLVAMYRLLPT